MDNKGIAHVFQEMGDMLEVKGENIFRVNAYKRAALTVMNFAGDFRDVVDKNPEKLLKIPGIGKELAKKIVELVQTGKCSEHEKMKKSFPEGLLELLNLRGVGPKKVKLFFGELGIDNLKKLEKAAKGHVLKDLPGMGEKSEYEILRAIEEYSRFSPERSLISEASLEAERIIKHMKNCKETGKIEFAGSLRRGQETVGDIDILVTSKKPESYEIIMNHFVKYKDVLKVVAFGETKSSVILENGMHVDLRFVKEESFGAALHYFTGDKEHNIRIRDLAKKRGMKVNEYGVFKGKKMIVCREEKDLFSALKLPFIIPEIRRNDGEIEYALKHKFFPKFIERKEIRGDFHSHSKYSDGDNTIEEMTLAFMSLGYEYFAVSDHSSLVKVAGGMGDKEIRAQWKEIDRLNKKFAKKIRILKGAEVDILKDGRLDFSDDILKELDVVIISAHMFNRLPSMQQTKRLITAVENPFVTIMGHPTGRLINKRAGMEFDMEKVIKACVANKVALEINANPERLDLAERHIKMAKDLGAKFSIGTDSHSTSNPEFMKFGISMARRGWLTADDVINARSLKNLTPLLKRVYSE